MPLVRTTAERIRSRLPAIVEVDDLSSSGMFGLMCAIDSYDMNQGAKFETFCAKRVRGAIFDNIRALDPASRLARRRESQVAKIRESFRKEHGRDIAEDELREQIDAVPEETDRIVRDSRVPVQSSLSAERAGPSGETVSIIDSIEGRREEGVSRIMQRTDLQDWVTKGLTPAERLVVLLYYYENMTMREIGIVLGRSESRVSQMHSLILQRLKARLRGADHEFEIAS
ncbi:MAG: sigma-70 family RNA polymerase sigma factor [Phycisphaeraceae bacterium]|nr:sigma-70 family RNA polymerase sigma factor [Phycisphaerales bacterium]MCB9859044.1 sigma-70 family RNA polymerase sigma factor [Phycisphaeraceae bacterium]